MEIYFFTEGDSEYNYLQEVRKVIRNNRSLRSKVKFTNPTKVNGLGKGPYSNTSIYKKIHGSLEGNIDGSSSNVGLWIDNDIFVKYRINIKAIDEKLHKDFPNNK